MISKSWYRAFTALMLLAISITASSVFAQQPPPGGANPRREMLEQRLRERTGQMVQKRLQLTDDQMKQLQSANRQFEKQRGELVAREREVRRNLRSEMTAEKPDQNRVAQLLDQTMQLERQRLDLVQNEQRELAKFLTPVQRARLFAIQNELRRRTQELRNRQMRRRNPGANRPSRFNQ